MNAKSLLAAGAGIILLALSPAAGADSPAAPSPAGKTVAVPPPPDDSTLEAKPYIYDPAGRRDPFKSLLVREKSREGDRPTGLAGLSVDEIELEGIWKTKSGFFAQIKGADNRSYLLRRGDILFDGEVVEVHASEVVLRQNVNDPQSVKPFRDVVKRLNPGRSE
jgi:type IV pilus assembly protein PilP